MVDALCRPRRVSAMIGSMRPQLQKQMRKQTQASDLLGLRPGLEPSVGASTSGNPVFAVSPHVSHRDPVPPNFTTVSGRRPGIWVWPCNSRTSRLPVQPKSALATNQPLLEPAVNADGQRGSLASGGRYHIIRPCSYVRFPSRTSWPASCMSTVHGSASVLSQCYALSANENQQDIHIVLIVRSIRSSNGTSLS